MKGDFTRDIFKKEKHYSSIRMQQGRVQLDADWNEQQDITTNRIETETKNVIGKCGAPLHEGGFKLVLKDNSLQIDPGSIYVDGILCENENLVVLTEQPNLPKDAEIVLKNDKSFKLSKAGPGVYLAFLDVWQRHITALEDPEIREVALGGPDTTTRTKIIWQVKLVYLGNINTDVNCVKKLEAWDKLIIPPDGKLAARAEKEIQSKDPCGLVSSAGYRRLENQLYRVEVHKGGNRNQASFKWSRDNGSIVTKWEKQDGNNLTVSSIGRDKILNFAGGQWIELTDDEQELLSKPGTLVKLSKVEGNVLTIDETTAIGTINFNAFPKNPKIRRWDSDGELGVTNSKFFDLEDGIQVKLELGSYRTGDYWLIPARTSTADVEWPIDTNTNEPELQSPHGIKHHYCKLGILKLNNNKWELVNDCRKIFPPVTELKNLFYVSGDGQEGTPGSILPEMLRVRVSNASIPVEAAKIKLTMEGNGSTSPANMIETNQEGIAECIWTLGEKEPQRVKAELLDAAGNPIPGQYIEFNGKILQIQGTGCSVTVGEGGKYKTLNEAFEELKKENDICICLLPGNHEIKENIEVDEKNIIKIIGCGHNASIINQRSKNIILTSGCILLQNVGINIFDEKGQVILSAQDLTSEQCAFKRMKTMKNSGPLVLVQPFRKSTINNICWKSNRMNSAPWIELSSKIWSYLIPERVRLTAELEKHLKNFTKINHVEHKKEFDKSIEILTKNISEKSYSFRNGWFTVRPEESINKLPTIQKNALKKFYTELNKRNINLKNLSNAIELIYKSFYLLHYTEALALTKNVGGWVIDNDIKGFVSLHFDPKAKYLEWGIISDENQRKRIQTWVERRFTILSNQMVLKIRGNNLFSVRSNGSSLMENIKTFLEGDLRRDVKQEGFETLIVEGNIFNVSGNSFICQWLTMSGNQFTNKYENNGAVAYTIGDSGVFVGNLGSTKGLIIDKFFKSSTEAANLIGVL